MLYRKLHKTGKSGIDEASIFNPRMLMYDTAKVEIQTGVTLFVVMSSPRRFHE